MTELQNQMDLPKGWAHFTLDNIASNKKNAIKRGPFGSSIKKEYFEPSGYKVYEQRNAIYNDFSAGKYYIGEKKFQELKDFELKPGDLLISCSGTIGKIALVPDNAQRGIINQALLKITLDPRIVFAKYFSYLFGSESFQKTVLKNTRGTAIKNITSVKDLKQIPLPIPPINEQYRIISKIEELFSFLDAGVESLRKVQAQLKRYRQAVLKYAFEGKLTEEWRKTHKKEIELGQELYEKIKQVRKTNLLKHPEISITKAIIQKLPPLPEEWTWISLEECCEVVSGYAFKSKDFTQSSEIPVIKIGNIGYSEFLWQDQEYLPQNFSEAFPKYIVPSDAILMALTRPITNDTLKACKYPKDAKAGLLNQRVAMINPRGCISKEELFLFMRSPIFKTQVTNGMSQTLQPNLSPLVLEQFQIPLFSSLEQEKIVAEIETKFSVADKISEIIEQSLRQTTSMRQGVLRDAFAGRLVPQNPADEPAEKLLDRIKSERIGNTKYKIDNKLELSGYVK